MFKLGDVAYTPLVGSFTIGATKIDTLTQLDKVNKDEVIDRYTTLERAYEVLELHAVAEFASAMCRIDRVRFMFNQIKDKKVEVCFV